MDAEGSVTRWLGQLRGGDPQAATLLWHRYYRRLLNAARHQLRGVPLRTEDEEDIALAALADFFRGAMQGKYPDATDRDRLEALLVSIALHKTVSAIRRWRTAKRGGGKVRGDSVYCQFEAADDGPANLDRALPPDPTAAFAARLSSLVDRLDRANPKWRLKDITALSLQGKEQEEIAAELGISVRTIQRRLDYLRQMLRTTEEDDQ